MKKQASIALFSGVVLFILVATLAYYAFFVSDDTYHVSTIYLTNGNTIEIRADTSWEISQSLYYSVSGSAFFTRFGGTIDTPRSLKFTALETDNGNQVAIIEASNPDIVLILHDFSNGNSWPFTYDTEDWNERQKRGVAMLTRIKTELDEEALVLSSGVPGNSSRRVFP